MPKLIVQTHKPKKLPRLYHSRGNVVRLAEYVRLAQRQSPLSERPYINSRRIAKTLRERGYDIASHTNNQRAIANVALSPLQPKEYEYVIHGQRLARVW